jgi:predicted dinucleotide-binding enzyme
MTITRVGVLGGGPLGQSFARILATARVETVIGNGLHGESLAALASVLTGIARIATLREAAEEDIVFLSVAWGELGETLATVADWESRILIDATSPILPGPEVANLAGRTSSEIVSELSPGAQLVKAFNTLPPDVLTLDPQQAGGRRVVFYSGDHLRAKIEVGRLIRQLGFAGIDLGGLSSGGRLQQFPDGPLWGQNLLSASENDAHQAGSDASRSRASIRSAVSKPSSKPA